MLIWKKRQTLKQSKTAIIQGEKKKNIITERKKIDWRFENWPPEGVPYITITLTNPDFPKPFVIYATHSSQYESLGGAKKGLVGQPFPEDLGLPKIAEILGNNFQVTVSKETGKPISPEMPEPWAKRNDETSW